MDGLEHDRLLHDVLHLLLQQRQQLLLLLQVGGGARLGHGAGRAGRGVGHDAGGDKMWRKKIRISWSSELARFFASLATTTYTAGDVPN